MHGYRVEAAATEVLILLLLLLDVSMTIYGLKKDERELGSGVDNPLNVVTGCILFVFTFEALVRVFGYRMSLLNGTRMLETVDLVVVIASIIVYLLTITNLGDKRNKDIVVIARVLRFLRLIKVLSMMLHRTPLLFALEIEPLPINVNHCATTPNHCA